MKETLLYTYKLKLETSEIELLELLNQVEEWIYSISDSFMRMVINRFIDNSDWK